MTLSCQSEGATFLVLFMYDNCMFGCDSHLEYMWCVEQGFLESLYNFYSSSLFQKNRERDAVMLYRMKNADDFNAHVAVIPYRSLSSSYASRFCTRGCTTFATSRLSFLLNVTAD